MYFIAQGECTVMVTDENKAEKEVCTLAAGNYFGEVALIKNCRRTASVFSKTYTTLAEFEKRKVHTSNIYR